MTPHEFIDRWSKSGGAELANSQSFLKELCQLLVVDEPQPTHADETHNQYVFEKAVEFNNGDGTTSAGRIDLYRRGAFVLESKQGSERKAAEQAQALATVTKQKKFKGGTAARGTQGWEVAMKKASEQARRYAQAIPGEWPPFLIVADVGYCFDIYADFSQSGKNYTQFPDTPSYRVPLDQLKDDKVRKLLRDIWLEPHSLDPAKRAAKVTRELAERLALLAKSLEGKHPPEEVAQFLMRCLFTMFAEDIELGGLKKRSFSNLLESLRGTPEGFVPTIKSLWQEMDRGTDFSPILRTKIQQFNGNLFANQTVLPLTEDQLELLIEAAKAEWTEVEPAIFGTLLERALDPHERHKLGAHYTPRAYVERLVMPTIIEPLREDWNVAYAAAVALHEAGKDKEAIATLHEFHEKLCETRVLDPACGSGNFLYVALELMKKLEGEVLDSLQKMGEKQALLEIHTVDPHQFLGIEINPRAAAITDLVLWIGYLQWHFRTRGKNATIAPPIIRKYDNIECRDAVLAWDRVEEVQDDHGQPVTRWDGRTMKIHPVTGEEVPDETARVQMVKFINPKKAKWPKADFVVGNPPFIGSKIMRQALGDEYVDALQAAWPEVAQATDFVLRWWHHAANLTKSGAVRRFGLIGTNSIRQVYNRRVIAPHLTGADRLSIVFATPDHPWVDSRDGAAVRIAMTTCKAGVASGELLLVTEEHIDSSLTGELVASTSSRVGMINADLSTGIDVGSATPLGSNAGLCTVGMKTIGRPPRKQGESTDDPFITTDEEAVQLGMGTVEGVDLHIRRYFSGRDFAGETRGIRVIDLFGMSEQLVRDRFPVIYQRLLTRSKPRREQNRNEVFRRLWWVIGHPREEFRRFTSGLRRYIATIETAKHRFFGFVPIDVVPDSTLVTFGFDDAYSLGILTSKVHALWCAPDAAGSTLEDRPRYNKSVCFEKFPFPLVQPTANSQQPTANSLSQAAYARWPSNSTRIASASKHCMLISP